MKISATLRLLLCSGTVVLFGTGGPAFAASKTTEAFLADINPTIDFLDRSSRMALDNSKAPRLRDFARGEAREQTLAANTLDAWIDTDKQQVVAANVGPDGLVTGRSVAIDRPVSVASFPPASQEDLDRMYGLTGQEFDDSYKTTQTGALEQLVVSYQEYITNGDEPVLKGLATSELPKINRRLTELGKL